MTSKLGLFDMFAYALPGSAYVAVFAYALARLGWLDLPMLLAKYSAISIVAGFVLSYVVGHVSYSLGRRTWRILPGYRRSRDTAIDIFLARCPEGRAVTSLDSFMLLAAIEVSNRDLAVEITRLRAVGVMLKNLVVPLTIAIVVALVEAFNGRVLQSMAGAFVLVLLAFGALVNGREKAQWAQKKTFEVAFWLPSVRSVAGLPVLY